MLATTARSGSRERPWSAKRNPRPPSPVGRPSTTSSSSAASGTSPTPPGRQHLSGLPTGCRKMNIGSDRFMPPQENGPHRSCSLYGIKPAGSGFDFFRDLGSHVVSRTRPRGPMSAGANWQRTHVSFVIANVGRRVPTVKVRGGRIFESDKRFRSNASMGLYVTGRLSQ